jgi:GT2 family glycosyltransferase
MRTIPDICVAIPSYNRGEVLVDTIKDVLKQSYKNLELLVIDQSSTHAPEVMASINTIKDPRFRHVKATPPSLPAARNLALKLSKAPIVLFLDDDVVLHKDMVKYHLAAFRKDKDICAVAGRVLQEGFPVKKEVLKFDEYGTSHGVFTASVASYTNSFPGGNHSIKVKKALSIGGFDTRYYYNAFREESDMAHRLVKHGMKIYFEPKAALTHLAVPNGGTRAKKTYTHIYDTPYFYRNELFFTLRVVNRKKLVSALRRKYREYCLTPSRKQGLRRRVYFCIGFVAALWRLLFGRQIISKVVT